MSTDMATMDIRELIASLRVQASELPPADIIRLLFIQVMTNRLEEQANRADKAEKRIEGLRQHIIRLKKK